MKQAAGPQSQPQQQQQQQQGGKALAGNAASFPNVSVAPRVLINSFGNNTNAPSPDPVIAVNKADGTISIANQERFEPRWRHDWYPQELIDAITKLNSTGKEIDPLDDPKFNPIEYINDKFPDGQSLKGVDQVIAQIKARIGIIDEDTLREVRNQAKLGSSGPDRLVATRKTVVEMLGTVRGISSQANQSEVMLNAVCHDLRGLDNVKKHISHEIAVLRNLKELVEGVDQLKLHVTKRQYAMIANILEEVLQISQEFQRYKTNLKVQNLTNTIAILSGDLKTQVHEEFRAYQPGVGGPISVHGGQRLSEVCLVVDALGPDFKKEFLDWFIDSRLRDYQIRFGSQLRSSGVPLSRPPAPKQNKSTNNGSGSGGSSGGSNSSGGDAYDENEDNSGLDRAHARYDWFRRELQVYDDAFVNVFPIEWHMDEKVTEEFCVQTRLALSAQLEATKRNLDVKGLLKAINKTAEFEKEMSKRFPSIKEEEPESVGNLEDESRAEDENYSVESIRRKWQQKEDELKARNEAKKMPVRPKWKGMIGSCFDPYMDKYVEQEEHNMKEILENITAEWGDKIWSMEDEAGNNVLAGSTELILYFTQALRRCSKLTVNQPLYDLTSLCKRYFTMYARFLLRKVPDAAPLQVSQGPSLLSGILQTTSNATNGPTAINNNNYTSTSNLGGSSPNLTSQSQASSALLSSSVTSAASAGNVNTSPIDERTVCLITNTAEYCAKSAESMAQTLREAIAEQFKDQIDLEQEKAEFQEVVAKSLRALAGIVVTKMETYLPLMVEVARREMDAVGDQSKYVGNLKSIVTESSSQYVKFLSPAHYRHFCNVLVGVVVPRLYNTVWRSNRYTEASSQQVLLDITAVKDSLLRLSTEPNERKAKLYTKLVASEFDKVEGILKTLASPLESVVQTYAALVPQGSDTEFSRLLEMKGVRYPDHGALVDKYLSITNKKRSDIGMVAGMAGGIASLFNTLPSNIPNVNLSLPTPLRGRLPGARS